MIVVDRHAFEDLWPALAVWLILFVIAGDAWTILRRAAALELGRPAQAVIVAKRRRSGRDYVSLDVAGSISKEAVGRGWTGLKVGQTAAVHIWDDAAFLDDDFGYSRWKSIVFGASFLLLWIWAVARYRFG